MSDQNQSRSHDPAPDALRGATGRERADAEIERLARQRQLALDAARLGWWHYDPNTRVATFDDRYAEIFGVSGPQRNNDEILSRIIHPDDLPGVWAKVEAALDPRDPRPYVAEYRINRPDGVMRWIEAHGLAAFEGAGESRRAVSFVGTVADITEQKQAEQALRQSREDLARAQEVGQIGWWRLDTLRNVLEWSDQSYHIFGVPRGTPLTYEAFLGIVHPDDRQYVDTKWQAGLRGDPYDIEHRIVAGGQVKWVRERAYLERNEAGEVLGGFGITQDITNRKQAEEQLRATRESLRLSEEQRKVSEAVRTERQRFYDVLETLPVYVALLSPDYHVPFANRFFRERFGESHGRRCYEYLFNRETPCEICESFTAFGTSKPHRWLWTGPDARDYDIYDYPFIDADGSPLVLEMGIDITDRKRAERELQEALGRLATRATQLRALASELTLSEQRERTRLARILHDHLQQLLIGAKFRSETLSRSRDEATRQAAAEIERLLEASISASRSLTSELSPPILREGDLPVCLEWLARWMADRHGLKIDLTVDGPLPRLADDVKVLLFEAVRELLLNVVKHAQVGSASINACQVSGDIRITVSDGGRGFDPGAVKKAGETGGGFGLFSIRERLDMLGGRMVIDSAPGQGSRFVLTAPRGEPTAVEPSAVSIPVQPTARKHAARVSSPTPGARFRVLLADDHTVVREGLKALLGEEPDILIVGEAAHGLEAVELARELRPDVILMDVSLPKLNGVEATRAIRNAHPDIRIIGLSMFEDHERAHQMRDAGAVDYVAKSAPSTDLIAAIRLAGVPSERIDRGVREVPPPYQQGAARGQARHRRSSPRRP